MTEPSSELQPFLLQTRTWAGLPSKDIPALQKQYGKNVFTDPHSGGFFRMVVGIVTEPMFLMLVGASLLYFILGEPQEGLMMLGAILIVSAISIFQELKSSRALSLLKEFTAPQVVVFRDGGEKIIPTGELVPGDIIRLEEGGRVPADISLLQANDLSVNESVITGESFPVDKDGQPGNNLLLQGTTINSGRCIGKVSATGNNTVLGKLGKSMADISASKTLLQDQISHFVKLMAFFGVFSFILIWVLNYFHTGDVGQSLLLGLTLAMSAIPEEIPVAFTSFMALGAYHLSGLGIITRQPQTIENLGAVSVICLDKTGTITENRMELSLLYAAESGLLEQLQPGTNSRNIRVLRFARLASEEVPFDPMEKAILAAFYEYDAARPGDGDLRMVHEYPLEGKPPMMTHVWGNASGRVIAAKGAPERILQACGTEEEEMAGVRKAALKMAAEGYRVLGVASVEFHEGPFPKGQEDFNWRFEGLIGLYDPPKKNAHQVFNKWYDAGIGIKLITGDYAATAIHVARETGIQELEQFLTGEEVMEMPDTDLRLRVKSISVFARMFPEAKLKVVEALKANGEIVAMTGDGVNDGPALKSAHIGIAMGNHGTEIAREAADLIITDDNLDKITDAIRQGRKIYANLKKAIRYIISIHVPIILTASMPLVLGWKFPNIFSPIHVIFLELIMGPTCSIFFEREPVEYNQMQQPPRQRNRTMFSGGELGISLLQGLVISTVLLSLYYYFMQNGYRLTFVRTLVFTTLILSNLFLTFVNRSFDFTLRQTFKYNNALSLPLVLVSAVFLSLILLVPFCRQLFGLSVIDPVHFLVCTALALAGTGWFELYKASHRRLI